jgi:hypothetical protein
MKFTSPNKRTSDCGFRQKVQRLIFALGLPLGIGFGLGFALHLERSLVLCTGSSWAADEDIIVQADHRR